MASPVPPNVDHHVHSRGGPHPPRDVAAEHTGAAPGRETRIAVTPPNFQRATFTLVGLSPLVVHRFSQKVKRELLAKQLAGNTARSKSKREAMDPQKLFADSRYTSPEGWDGFHAAALRNALISACRLVRFKMTLARLSIFVVADGYDAQEPQIPLVRIYGEPQMIQDIARVQTGEPYVTVRAAYYPWSAKPTISWDADQFSAADVANLLTRVGLQVGIGEGRPDSKRSAGMGWGLFEID